MPRVCNVHGPQITLQIEHSQAARHFTTEHWPTDWWLTDWLTGWLTDRLFWLTDWLADWLTGWLPGGVSHVLTNWSTDLSLTWLSCNSAGEPDGLSFLHLHGAGFLLYPWGLGLGIQLQLQRQHLQWLCGDWKQNKWGSAQRAETSQLKLQVWQHHL